MIPYRAYVIYENLKYRAVIYLDCDLGFPVLRDPVVSVPRSDKVHTREWDSRNAVEENIRAILKDAENFLEDKGVVVNRYYEDMRYYINRKEGK